MSEKIGFGPVARADARALVLGSLPGAESLRRHEYYGHRANAFWPIMGELFGAAPDLPYARRLEILCENRIALWDVCAGAEREGSLDSAIRAPRANDFGAFFDAHREIEKICFNGQTARKFFDRLVAPDLPRDRALRLATLPSTSPAHTLAFAQKLKAWRSEIL